MRILGIDPSVRATGLIVIDGSGKIIDSKCAGYSITKATETDRIKRNLDIAKEIVMFAKKTKVDLIGIEGYGAMSKKGRMGNQIQLFELGGVIKSQIVLSLNKVPKVIPPPSWKKEVMNNGRASKDDVKNFLNNVGYKLNTEDEYDALGIAIATLKMQSVASKRELKCRV